MSYMEYTGTTKAIETVDLRARVKGFLKQRLFREGEEVKQGQLLLVIDEEPFQVTLEIAQAKLEAAQAGVKKAEESKAREVAKAQLDLDQAAYQLAKVEENRQRSLLQAQRRRHRKISTRPRPTARRPGPRSRPTAPTSSRPRPTT